MRKAEDQEFTVHVFVVKKDRQDLSKQTSKICLINVYKEWCWLGKEVVCPFLVVFTQTQEELI